MHQLHHPHFGQAFLWVHHYTHCTTAFPGASQNTSTGVVETINFSIIETSSSLEVSKYEHPENMGHTQEILRTYVNLLDED